MNLAGVERRPFMKRAFEFTDELTHAGTETPRGERCRETEATAENVLARHLQGDPSRFGHTDGDHRLPEQGKPPQRFAESTGFLVVLLRGLEGARDGRCRAD